MKILIITTLMITIASTILCSCASPATAEIVVLPALPNTSVVATDSAKILGSTVLIVVQSSMSFDDLSLSYGIGTLIKQNGEIFLVTHNHWGEVLEDDLATVEFRDAQNQMIMPMFASAFKELIVYQNPGMLVLRAIHELLVQVNPTQIEYTLQLEAGTILQVAYRAPPERESIAVLEAEIIRSSVFEGEPVYEIRCLNGQGLQMGDSGGGVWYNGMLVGNNWAILIDMDAVDIAGPTERASQATSVTSYTALIPEYFR